MKIRDKMMEEDRETCPNSSQEGMEVKHRKVLKEDQDEEKDSLVKEELLVEEKMGTVFQKQLKFATNQWHFRQCVY